MMATARKERASAHGGGVLEQLLAHPSACVRITRGLALKARLPDRR